MRDTLLDPLRGAAAVWVLLHHLAHAYAPRADAVELPFRLGYFGVPMFFVVSGYCLSAAGRRAVRTGAPPARFLSRRAVRILPPFWGAVVVAAAVSAALPRFGTPLGPVEVTAHQSFRESTPLEWVQVATLTTGLRPTGELPWHKFQFANMAFWTLAVELQFYAVVCVVVCVAVWSGRWFYQVLLGVTLLLLPFALSESAFRSGAFLACWPGFALGVGLFAARERGWELRAKSLRVAVLACAFGAIAGGLVVAPLDPDGGRDMLKGELLFAAGLTAALWAIGRSEVERPAGAAFGYLGTVSYSVYLLHVPLMYPVAHAVGAVAPPGGPTFLALVTGLICAIAYPFYWLVERPCMSRAAGHSPGTNGAA